MKAGRKRNVTVVRETNGRAKRERPVDPKTIAARQPHRQGVDLAVVHDPKAATNFGRLVLFGRISQIQYDAGAQFAAVVNRYRSVIEAPKADPISLSGAAIGAIGSPRWMDDEIARAWKEEYDSATIALENGAGNRGMRAVSRWAVYDKSDTSIDYLICGLNVLIKHFGLNARANQRLRH